MPITTLKKKRKVYAICCKRLLVCGKMEWEDPELFPQAYQNRNYLQKEFIQLIIQQTNNPIKKWAEDKMTFPKKTYIKLLPWYVYLINILNLSWSRRRNQKENSGIVNRERRKSWEPGSVSSQSQCAPGWSWRGSCSVLRLGHIPVAHYCL